ncbi:hypothetical protein ABVK25_004482 [Lepraria finkii]|uniref:Uncharacterized protein n=1 Tax=Lepraria finkii TaxID=1340010 RepID=A0ABR4BEB6_9LECA
MPAALIDQGQRIPPSLQEALDHIRSASEIQRKKKFPVLKSWLDTVHSHAERYGLPCSALRILIDATALPSSLYQTSQNAIIKSLYPAGKVSSNLICIVIGSLGHGSRKATVSTQQMLLRWVIMVSDYLEEAAQLSSFYNILFNLLDMMSLRAELCHLLARITRRKHVRPFRIQMLQELSRSVGQDAALLKLMHVYDKYAPGFFELGKTKKTLDFPHPDPEWGSQLERIQKGTVPLSVKTNSQLASSRFLGRSTTTTPYTGSTSQQSNGTDIFVNQLENVKISDLTTSDLEDPVLQRYMMLKARTAGLSDVDEYLTPVFEEHLQKIVSGQRRSQEISRLLESLLDYTRYTKLQNRLRRRNSPAAAASQTHPRSQRNPDGHLQPPFPLAGLQCVRRTRSGVPSPIGHHTAALVLHGVLRPATFALRAVLAEQ